MPSRGFRCFVCLKAVKIALEVKKHLVDNDFMDISQVRGTRCPM